MNTLSNEFGQVPVVILCGGSSVVLDRQNSMRLNKALVQVHGKPLFYWVMHHYTLHGAKDFLLATGFQSDQFGSVLDALGARPPSNQDGLYKLAVAGTICRVRLVPTAPDATTAARLLACKPWLADADRFALTYSDTLSDVNLSGEMLFHKSQDMISTLVSTKCPIRFRILGIRQGECIVRAFAQRPVIEAASINGGYYIFSAALWNEAYGLDDLVALENQPLERLAAASQLAAFEHKGNWQNCDTERDLAVLEQLAKGLEVMAHV